MESGVCQATVLFVAPWARKRARLVRSHVLLPCIFIAEGLPAFIAVHAGLPCNAFFASALAIALAPLGGRELGARALVTALRTIAHARYRLLSVRPSVRPSVRLSVRLSVCVSVCVFVTQILRCGSIYDVTFKLSSLGISTMT